MDDSSPLIPLADSLSLFKFLVQISQLQGNGVEIIECKLSDLLVVDGSRILRPLHFGLSILLVNLQMVEEFANGSWPVVLARLEELPHQGVLIGQPLKP